MNGKSRIILLKSVLLKSTASSIHKTFNKVLLTLRNRVVTCILFFVLAFSQTLSYASAPCSMESDMDMSMHAGMEHDMPDDCCNEECECPEGTFSSFSLLRYKPITEFSRQQAIAINQVQHFVDAFIPQDVKPPILA